MAHIFEKFSLSGKVALVTGGAGLLGREFCLTLAQAGAEVFVADLNLGLAESAAAEISAQGFDAHGIMLDVTDPSSVNSVVAEIVTRSGRVDVLVNSAALDPKFDPQHASTSSNAFESYPLKSWQDGKIRSRLRKSCFFCNHRRRYALFAKLLHLHQKIELTRKQEQNPHRRFP